jgi:hypothetical protein
MEVTERRGRIVKQLLDGPKEKRGYRKLKEWTLDCTLWRTRFGKVCGPVVRQTTEWLTEWINEYMNGPFSFGTKRPDHKLSAHFRSVLKFKIQGMFFPSPLYTFTALCPDTVAIDLSAGITARTPSSPPPLSRPVLVLRLSRRRVLSSVL